MFDAARAGEEWQPEARKAQLHPGLLGRGGRGTRRRFSAEKTHILCLLPPPIQRQQAFAVTSAPQLTTREVRKRNKTFAVLTVPLFRR